MEILLDIFLDFLIEGTAEIAKSKKAPKSLRIFILTVIVGTMFLLFFLSYLAREDETMMWSFFVFGSFIALFLLTLFYKFMKSKNPEWGSFEFYPCMNKDIHYSCMLIKFLPISGRHNEKNEFTINGSITNFNRLTV